LPGVNLPVAISENSPAFQPCVQRAQPSENCPALQRWAAPTRPPNCFAIYQAGNSIAQVRTDPGRREIRYETIIATLVGVSALFVSGYTAYVQRQQVRAAVWPILEYGTSSEPKIRFTLDNKGGGPAIIRNVIVRVDANSRSTTTEVRTCPDNSAISFEQ
jgi:hypothetical protein